jgi:glycosyltransferase involved in cell wall biosynthesis
MKILVVTNMYPHAGDLSSGVFVMQQVNYLRKYGHHVDVYHIRGFLSKFNYLKASWDVFIRTIRESYDLVHVHYGLSGISALFRWKTPMVITLHGSDVLIGKIQPMISRFVCKFSDAVIIVSKKMADKIQGKVIPCGIDLDVFKPYDRKESRLRLGLPLNKFIILFPFHPSRKIKRYDLAEAAIKSLVEKGYDIELLTVTGVKNENMPYYYSASDAMILCSESEGSPTSVKEALACNIPVVSTNVGDVNEILDGIQGVEICRNDIESLSRGLLNVLKTLSMDNYDYRIAVKRYDQEILGQSIIDVYKDIINK